MTKQRQQRAGAVPVKKRTEKKRALPAVESRRPPTERERRAIAAAREAIDKLPDRVAYDVGFDVADGRAWFESEHSDEDGATAMLAHTLGTRSDALIDLALCWLMNAAKPKGGQYSSQQLNAALAFVAGVGPQNEMEALLAVQAFASHDLSMVMVQRAKNADYIEQAQQYTSMATKLSRTFTMQLEAMAKIRRGGEQIVRHIHVDNRGGQAVIAETVQTGGTNGNFVEQAREQHCQGYGGGAMLGQDAQGNRVPVTSAERKETL